MRFFKNIREDKLAIFTEETVLFRPGEHSTRSKNAFPDTKFCSESIAVHLKRVRQTIAEI